MLGLTLQIPRFPPLSSRACMVLAGLVAGGLTASTAFTSGPVAGMPRTEHLAVEVPTTSTPVAPPVDLSPYLEAAVLEAEDARSAPVAASRSASPTTPAPPATPGTFVRPALGAITGAFGERRGSRAHPGTDFDGDTGDPVFASGSGTVLHAGGAPAGYSGYGTVVLIDHGNNVTTLYAHLSRIAVRTGSSVGAGEVVGAMGTTGNVTGSHLHFELRLGDRSVNPSSWFRR